MFHKAFSLLLLGLLTTPTSAHAYYKTYHFYVTFTLAHVCGLPDAEQIAWSNYETDVYPGSSPGTHPGEWLDTAKVRDRRLFHFTVDAGADSSLHDSEASRDLLNEVFSATLPDGMFFGLALHPFQDSWSHEGYGPKTGHALHGTRPDQPYRDVPRALSMAQGTWRWLDRWSVLTLGAPCRVSWDSIEPLIERLSAKEISDSDKLASFWHDKIHELFGVDTSPQSLTTEAREERFAALVGAIKKVRP